MVHRQQDLLRANSPVQFAEIQRAIYLEGVNALFTYNATLLNTWVRGLGAHALNPRDTSVSYRRRIPGVCLCRSGGLSGVGHGDYLFRC
jgi:hypothetical protein